MLILHQIPVSEPATDGSGAFMLSCWRRKGLRIGKSESCQAQFLISQLKKGRSREGKWLTQCHIFSGGAKGLMKGSTELGVRSLGSDNTNQLPMPVLCPLSHGVASGPGECCSPQGYPYARFGQLQEWGGLCPVCNRHSHNYIETCPVESSLRTGMFGICLDSCQAVVPPGSWPYFFA